MAWATAADIKARWVAPEKFPSTDEQVTLFISDVEGEILSHFPKIEERIADGDITVNRIKSIVSTIVIEFLITKGQPFNMQTQAYTGAGSSTIMYKATSRTSLSLNAEDIEALSPNTKGKAFMINLIPTDSRTVRGPNV